MNCNIRINTERWENYGTESEPYWKIKGNTEFIIRGADSEEVMYLSNEIMNELISNMISEVSNSIESYKLIHWKLIFEEPIELPSERFHTKIVDIYNRDFGL
jgi:hypothetical protein